MNRFLAAFKPKRPERVVAIDLGASSTKAVYLERRDDQAVLLNYLILPGAGAEMRQSVSLMAEHLRSIHQGLGAKSRHISLALGPADGVFRNVELPEVPQASLRGMLMNNSRQYLHLELAGYEVDCAVISRLPAPSTGASSTANAEGGQGSLTSAGRPQSRQNVLMGAANRDLVDLLEQSAIEAGLILDEVTFTQSGLINAARQTCRQLLPTNAVALIDLGSKATSITILLDGEPILTRVISIGGDHLTATLAKESGPTRPEEATKRLLPSEIEFERLERVSQPLIRELRASIDFFEQLHERIVSHALITGGVASSDATIRVVQEGLVVPRCQMWNIAENAVLALPAVTAASFLNDTTQLGSALALAESLLMGTDRPINLLAERQEEAEMRRRDPVKRSFQAAAVAVGLMLFWGAIVRWQIYRAEQELATIQAEVATVKKQADAVTALGQKGAMTERQRARLNRQFRERFLWTGPLDALQFSMVDGVEVVRLQMDQTLLVTPATKPTTDAYGRVSQGKPVSVTHKMSVLISARDSGELPATEKFIAQLSAQPYFKERLREKDPVLLRERLPQQLDPLDASRRFIPFTIQCVFKEWRTEDE